MAPGWSPQCDCAGATGRKVANGKRENDDWILNRYSAILQTAALIVDLPADLEVGKKREHNKTLPCNLHIHDEGSDFQWSRTEMHNDDY